MKRTMVAGMLLTVVLAVATSAAVRWPMAYVDDISSLTNECAVQGIRLSESSVESAVTWQGTLPLGRGGRTVRIAVFDGLVEMRVDAAGDGRSESVEWERILVDGSFVASVRLVVAGAQEALAPYRIQLSWNRYLPALLIYCRDNYREGIVDFDGRPVQVAVIDADTDAAYDDLSDNVLLIDTDGDGHLLATADSHERFYGSEAFNVGGLSYRVEEMAVDGSWMDVEESDSEVAPKYPLLAGFDAPPLSGVTRRGTPVSLDALRGAIVVLDFWAGWCTPCVRELPTMSRIHETFDADDVVVLGINLDRSAEACDAAIAEYEVDYLQIFDGPSGPIGSTYRVQGIPMTYVIDRSGTIVARGLRGQELVDAVDDLAQLPEAGVGP